LRTDPHVIDLVLADTGFRLVGDKIVDPRFCECEITRRSIGERFGVLYAAKTADGFQNRNNSGKRISTALRISHCIDPVLLRSHSLC